jgi:hypothetical protein
MTGCLAAALLLLASGTTSVSGAAAFPAQLPVEVGDMTGWETASGDVSTPAVTGSYCFYVNPERQGLYQVMRYRVRFADGLGGSGIEKVVWNSKPGQRIPLVLWERVDLKDATNPLERQGWRVMSPGTTEYLVEMGRLIQLLAVHRTALRPID